MAAVVNAAEPIEQRVILRNVSWQTYEQLLDEQQASSGTRLNYDRGVLEIMILSLKHERFKHIIATLVELIAAELAIDIEGAGSTTFRCEDLARGFESDACFYIQHAESIRSKETIDLKMDPAPELVIEIDITHASLDKLPLFAEFGVAEVWRYDGHQLTIFYLENGIYKVQPKSHGLPEVSGEMISKFINLSQLMKRSVWLQHVREWTARVI